MKKIFVILLVLFSVTVSAKTPTKKVTVKVYNSKEYSIILDKFMIRAEKYLETGDKKSLLDDYIKNIESSRVMKKALEDNYDKDKEAFSLVEVALFTKSSYSEGEDAKKLTDEDYKEMQEKFVKTKKYKQLEDYATIQTTNGIK
ncbi:hypothetical protein [Fusobacterium pseudoperiodonticum]|uniref:hypothetical protein n=1 Tax=Fusobacterium pseudoperiodonticum TaxID=2663009 RepID=UPI000C1B2DE5|nr:hypothetical protein [Fusobacterium pseudoperiodonticum]PIM77280.1 hypothetical protein CTM69_10745 [Fusobacterium pseudoperiodonticum]